MDFFLEPTGVQDLIKPMLRVPQFQSHTLAETLASVSKAAEVLGRSPLQRLLRSGLTIKVSEPPEWRYPQNAGYYRDNCHQIELCRLFLDSKIVLTNLARALFRLLEDRGCYDAYWAAERFDGLFKWGRWNQFQSRERYFVDSLLLFLDRPAELKKKDQGCAVFMEVLLRPTHCE